MSKKIIIEAECIWLVTDEVADDAEIDVEYFPTERVEEVVAVQSQTERERSRNKKMATKEKKSKNVLQIQPITPK